MILPLIDIEQFIRVVKPGKVSYPEEVHWNFSENYIIRVSSIYSFVVREVQNIPQQAFFDMLAVFRLLQRN